VIKHRVSLGLFAVILLLLSAVWTFWPRDKPTAGESAPLPAAKEVRTIEKIIERPKIVYVYPDKVKPELNLPPSVAADTAKKIIATGKLDADERPYTLSAVLDVETGDSQVYARPDPLPWIGPGRQGAVGIAYGIGNEGPTARIYARHDLLRIKALHAGVRAEADQRGEYWAGATVEWRF
jgi:hypothetical protein